MDDLRGHPNFIPLPRPETIEKLDSLEDVRMFRQDSWQWDAVHQGRCTTSQTVAALGFLEPEAGKILGVPRSWQRGGHGPYYRLQQPALNWRAMASHTSQFVWYRRLFVVFSCYTYVNRLKRRQGRSGSSCSQQQKRHSSSY